MRIAVIGLAATGSAVVAYARESGHDVTVIEDHPDGDTYRERAATARDAGAVIHEAPDAHDAATIARASDLVVPSPGVRPDHPAIVAAETSAIPVRSEIDLAAARLRARTSPAKLVAVTGTNGKTTVTTLVDAMLREAGRASIAAGNIGRPLLDAVADDTEVIVAEVSSFQLAYTTEAFGPDIAVLLNVAEDHLDWHGSADAYASAKAAIFRHQTAGALLIANADDPVVIHLATTAPGRVTTFSTADSLPQFDFPSDGSQHAPHDVANASAAALAAQELGADNEAIARALARFSGLPHRVQLVGEIDGVRFFDDSKATNPHATASALQGFTTVVLIAGGRNKALDLSVLRAHAKRVRAVVAIGEAAGDVERAFGAAVPVVRAASMADAVRSAAASAQPGDAVLLSPACASFDWYASYAARGDDFAREVARLVELRRSA